MDNPNPAAPEQPEVERRRRNWPIAVAILALATALFSHRLSTNGAGMLPAIAVVASVVRFSVVGLAGRRIARLSAAAS